MSKKLWNILGLANMGLALFVSVNALVPPSERIVSLNCGLILALISLTVSLAWGWQTRPKRAKSGQLTREGIDEMWESEYKDIYDWHYEKYGDREESHNMATNVATRRVEDLLYADYRKQVKGKGEEPLSRNQWMEEIGIWQPPLPGQR